MKNEIIKKKKNVEVLILLSCATMKGEVIKIRNQYKLRKKENNKVEHIMKYIFSINFFFGIKILKVLNV